MPEQTVAPETAQPETTTPQQQGDTTPTQAAQTPTQADIDRIVKERLAREREKYKDYDTYKAAAEELKKLKDAQLSETERLQKQLAEEKAAREKTAQKANLALVRSAILAEAAKLNFNDPLDAFKLLDPLKFEVDPETDEVKGIAEAVKKLAEERKYLLKAQGGQPLEPFAPSGPGGQVRETRQQRLARIYGGQSFDSIDPAQHGGGVIIHAKGNAPGQ